MNCRSLVIPLIALLSVATAIGKSPLTNQEECQEHKMLVLLTEFSDLKFSNDTSSIDSLLGLSLKYFTDAFPENYQFSYTVSSVITLPNPVAYYGANTSTGKDIRPGVLVYQACKEAEKYIDFSQFDNDEDGTVDYVIIITAGGNEAEDGITDHIWPHKWDLYSANKESGDYDKLSLKVDGKYINEYSITSELKHDAGNYALCGIGSICHEMGHTLGLVDLYDTDYEWSGGLSNGLWGSISLMDKGNFNDDGNTPPPFCALELFQTGIGMSDTLSEGNFKLPPVESSKRYMVVPGEDCADEFFLIECRDHKGLLFYHVDMSDYPAGFSSSRNEVISAHQRWFNFNEVNCRPDFQCAEIIPKADSVCCIEDLFWTSGDGPVMEFRHSRKSELIIKNIQVKTNGSVSFRCIGPEIAEIKAVCFQNAAILSWECASGGSCSILCEEDTVATGIGSYEKGKYAYVMTGLTPKTQYYIRIFEETKGIKADLTFTTKAYYPKSLPFIYLNDTPRNPNGTFSKGTRIPLMINGAPYAEEVEWHFNDNSIHTGKDGYFTLQYSGTLKAEISNSDGSVDIITKEIVVQ